MDGHQFIGVFKGLRFCTTFQSSQHLLRSQYLLAVFLVNKHAVLKVSIAARILMNSNTGMLRKQSRISVELRGIIKLDAAAFQCGGGPVD